MPVKTKPLDAAGYLTSPAMVVGYFNEAVATGDPAVVRQALGAVARVRSIQHLVHTVPDDNGTILITCPSFPEVATFAETEDDIERVALAAIEEAIAARSGKPG